MVKEKHLQEKSEIHFQKAIAAEANGINYPDVTETLVSPTLTLKNNTKKIIFEIKILIE